MACRNVVARFVSNQLKYTWCCAFTGVYDVHFCVKVITHLVPLHTSSAVNVAFLTLTSLHRMRLPKAALLYMAWLEFHCTAHHCMTYTHTRIRSHRCHNWFVQLCWDFASQVMSQP